MKKSKKLLAFLLSATMVCALPAVLAGCGDDDDNPPDVTQTDPVKIKDGAALTVEVGKSEKITVSDYITANGTTVEVKSSNASVAEATLSGGVVTVTGKAEGTATLTLTCGSVKVTFSLTVKKANKKAPTLNDVTASLDLRDKAFVEVNLPSAEDFDIVYSVDKLNENVAAVTGGVLKFTPAETGEYSVKVTAKCTEKGNASNVCNVTFNVKISVTRSQESVKYTVSVDGEETKVESGGEFTLPEYENVPDGKVFKGWQVGGELKQAGDKITVTGDVTVVSVLETKKYTVTVDGVAQSEKIEHGGTFTLPQYNKPLEDGKQFNGWQVGGEVKGAGSQITVTGDLLITAVIGDIPQTPPELVKAEGTLSLVTGGDEAVKEINISEYITTNGHAVSVNNGNPSAVSISSADGKITVTAIAEGRAEITITCGSLTATVTCDVSYPAPEKIKDGESREFLLSAGTNTINVAEYITANGNSVTVASSEETVATVSLSDGTVTITALKAGRTTVSVTCKSITLTFPVTVKNAVPAFENGSIEIDKYAGTTGTYTIVSDGADSYEYEYAVEGATVTDGVLSVTATENKTLTVNVTATDTATGAVERVSFTVTVTVVDGTPALKQSSVTETQTRDVFDGKVTVDLSANVNDPKGHVIGYKVGGTDVEGSEYEVTGNFGLDAQNISLDVTVIFDNDATLEYTYTVSVRDTSEYRILNGGFDSWKDGKPVDWTVTDGYGSEQTASTYWDENRPFDNFGSYFGETDENKTGTLQSPSFKVGNSGWITFQLGSANPAADIWVEIRNADDSLIGKFKNSQWSDPENAQRLIPYKVDLSAYSNQSVYIRIVDNQGAGAMGFRTFFADSFETWYDSEPVQISEGKAFINLGAPTFENKTVEHDLKDGAALSVELPKILLGVSADCTYTTEFAGASINGGTLTYTASKAGVYVIPVKGETAHGNSHFSVTVTVTNTRERPSVESKNIGQVNVDTSTLAISETLSAGNDNFALTYALKEAVTGAALSGNTFTYTADPGQDKGTVDVVLTVTFTDKEYPQEVYTQDITLSVTIVGSEPVIIKDEVTSEIDLEGATEKAVALDLSANVTVPDGVSVTYSVTGAEGSVNGSEFGATLAAGTYNLTVKVTYGSGELTYAYIVKVAQYSVINGDFETGSDSGWTYTKDGDKDFGIIVNADNYFNGNSFNKQGDYLFTGVETNPSNGNFEAGKGTLKSSNFTLKQNGWISFLLGGAHNVRVGIRVREASNDTILAEFNNKGQGVDGAMDRYIYKFAGMDSDTECYIEVFDDAEGDWGCIAFDDIRTAWGQTRPEGEGHENAKEIVPCYVKGQKQVFNGNFDKGSVGWEITTTARNEGGGNFADVNTSGGNVDFIWGDNTNSYNNDGNFLQNMDEASKGYALSSTFEASEWMTFKLGGNKNDCYVAIVDAVTGEELAKFVNENFVGAFPEKGWEMYSYKANLAECGIAAGRLVKIKIVDNAVSDYGVVVADSFVTDYGEEPDSTFTTVTNKL